MNPAFEQQVRTSVREALHKIANGTALTRADAFGEGTDAEKNRSLRILRDLAARGLIESVAVGTRKLHSPKDPEALKALADDETGLGALIWPGRAPEPGELPPFDLVSNLASDEPGAPTTEPSTAAPDPPDLAEQIGTTLRLVAALSENIIYIREQLDALRAQVAQIGVAK